MSNIVYSWFIYQFIGICFNIKKKEFEDTKGVIRNYKLKNDRQHNGQKEKDKRTNNDLQNIHIKLKIEQHEPHSKPGVNVGATDGKKFLLQVRSNISIFCTVGLFIYILSKAHQGLCCIVILTCRL